MSVVLTEMSALEMAVCVAQYFYYEKDNPIMSDFEYDQLEVRLRRYKQRHEYSGVFPDIFDKVGNGNNIKYWLKNWKDRQL